MDFNKVVENFNRAFTIPAAGSCEVVSELQRGISGSLPHESPQIKVLLSSFAAPGASGVCQRRNSAWYDEALPAQKFYSK